MSAHYYNTTRARGRQLRQYESVAKFQDERVKAVFEFHKPFGLTPWQVHRALGAKAPLITSVRRAITNLTDAGVLVKDEEKVLGPYGHPEHKWRLKGAPKQERLSL